MQEGAVEELSKCCACKKVSYCGIECQKSNLRIHKMSVHLFQNDVNEFS